MPPTVFFTTWIDPACFASVKVQMVSNPGRISKSVMPALAAPSVGSVGNVPVAVVGLVWMTHETLVSFQVAGIASLRS